MIRNILFDMGNVLIYFDRNLFMDRLGVSEEDKKRLIEAEWQQPDNKVSEIADWDMSLLNEEIGEDVVFQVAGNPLQPSYATAKIIWYKENLPEVYAKIWKILQSNSFIAYHSLKMYPFINNLDIMISVLTF